MSSDEQAHNALPHNNANSDGESSQDEGHSIQMPSKRARVDDDAHNGHHEPRDSHPNSSHGEGVAHTVHMENLPRSDEILVPALQPLPITDPELLARIRHPSFQSGLAVMLQGDRHNADCPVGAEAGPYNHTRDCTCMKRSMRPGRRRATIIVSESDLMKYPLKQFNAFIQDSGLADSHYVEYTRYLREMWHMNSANKERLPEGTCELGCGHLKEFRQLLQNACLTPNGVRFLEEERERFMNRRQQHNSRQRRKERIRDSDGGSDASPYASPAMHTRASEPRSGSQLPPSFNAQQFPQNGYAPGFMLPQMSPQGTPDMMRMQQQRGGMAYPYQWPAPAGGGHGLIMGPQQQQQGNMAVMVGPQQQMLQPGQQMLGPQQQSSLAVMMAPQSQQQGGMMMLPGQQQQGNMAMVVGLQGHHQGHQGHPQGMMGQGQGHPREAMGQQGGGMYMKGSQQQQYLLNPMMHQGQGGQTPSELDAARNLSMISNNLWSHSMQRRGAEYEGPQLPPERVHGREVRQSDDGDDDKEQPGQSFSNPDSRFSH